MSHDRRPPDDFERLVYHVLRASQAYCAERPADNPTFKGKYLDLEHAGDPDNRRVGKALKRLEKLGIVETVRQADHGATYRLTETGRVLDVVSPELNAQGHAHERGVESDRDADVPPGDGRDD